MKIAIALCAFLALLACSERKGKSAPEIEAGTKEFLKTYQGKFTNKEDGEYFEFFSSGVFRSKQIRQVGREGTKIPYPTSCSYFEEGRITKVKKRTAENTNQFSTVCRLRAQSGGEKNYPGSFRRRQTRCSLRNF